MRVGESIADYRVEGVLGEGGMGTVYRATNVRLDRVVALKVLDLSRFAVELRGELRSRFFLEASMAAKLTHPNVVSVHDFGAADEQRSYIAMELIEGPSLESYLTSNGALPAEEAIRVAFEAARALRAAHARGVIHRDLKPGNLMLQGEERTVKLVDFGLVKDVNAPQLTQQGRFLGTLGYLAPETINGGAVGERSDLYALGVVLFECLTGSQPFAGPVPAQVMNQVVNQPAPTLRERAKGQVFSAELEALVARLLSKNPNDRLGTADEVLAALATLPESRLPGRALTPIPSSTSPRVPQSPAPRFTARALLGASEGLHSGLGSDGKEVILQLLPKLSVVEQEKVARSARGWNDLGHSAVVHTVGVETVAVGTELRSAVVYSSEAVETLEGLQAEVEMTGAAALRLAVQLFDVVAAAHRAGLVHGRLSPSAVLVEASGAIAVRAPAGLALDPAAPWVDPEQDPWRAGEADDLYSAAMLILTSLDPMNERLEFGSINRLTRVLAPCLAERAVRPTASAIREKLRALVRHRRATVEAVQQLR